ncbi:MAG TPA: DUF4240 domain-containing protein [Gemmatales bacterium]|nr:DUF4240 domain-containing protein [Gemmatales bacterium]
MDRPEFWNLIDQAREHGQGINDVMRAKLKEKLQSLSPQHVMSFSQHYYGLLRNAYSWKLAGPAWLIGCGIPSDAFLDFCGWLIALGQERYEQILIEPDQLAEMPGDVPQNDWFFEFEGMPNSIYEQMTGQQMPDDHQFHPQEITGIEPPDFEVGSLAASYPRLWVRLESTVVPDSWDPNSCTEVDVSISWANGYPSPQEMSILREMIPSWRDRSARELLIEARKV